MTEASEGQRLQNYKLLNHIAMVSKSGPFRLPGIPSRLAKKVHRLLKACVDGKQPHDFVFTWDNGEPVLDFRTAWGNMSSAAGVSVLLHDFRRTAVRNMIRAGVSRDVAKKISGHATDSIFSRYNITNENDLSEAAAKIEARKIGRKLDTERSETAVHSVSR
jgi:hypothetical protein